MADRWRPKDATDGRYVWLPVKFEMGLPVLRWLDRWELSVFDRSGVTSDVNTPTLSVANSD